MSHYQQHYYGAAAPAPPSSAPIQSSFYAARQRFEQPQAQAQAQVAAAPAPPPHLRQSALNYQQHAAPPRHPLQQSRGGGVGHTPHGQGHAQPRPQLTRPTSQYGQVQQQYQPPYAQPQTAVQRPMSYAPPAPVQYPPQSEFTPAQYAQRMYGFNPMSFQPQMRAQPTPAQALAAYEAYNARNPQPPPPAPPPAPVPVPQQQQPPQPQAQFGRPVVAPPMAPSMSVPPGPQTHNPTPGGNPMATTRRPLPQPTPGAPQARPRPMSMPPQSQFLPYAPVQQGFGNPASASSSHVALQSYARSTSPAPPVHHSLPPSSLPSVQQSPTKNPPGLANMDTVRTPSPEKGASTLETPTRRRALPHSPTAPPDLTQLQRTKSGSVPVPTPISPTKPTHTTSYFPPQPLQNLPQAPPLKRSLTSDSEGDDRLSAAGQESNDTEGGTPSPQYGILDLPRRNVPAKTDPPSPQYGIKDLPARTKSVVDRRRAWQRAEQEMNASKPDSPTKSFAQVPSLNTPVTAPVAPSRSPQPQTPQQAQKLPMPVVRQPQPSRSERTPSWTLPTADLDTIAGGGGGEQKTSMALRFATMAIEEEKADAKAAKTAVTTPQSQPQRPGTQGSNAPRTVSPSKPYPFSTRTPRRSTTVDLNLDDAPPPSLRRTPSPSTSTASSSVPSIPMVKTPDDVSQFIPTKNSIPMIPQISLPGGLDLDDALGSVPSVNVQAPTVVVSPKPTSPRSGNIPLISLPGGDEEDNDSSGPMISVSAASPKATPVPMPVILDDLANAASQVKPRGLPKPPGGGARPIPTSSSSGSNLRSRGGGLVCGGCHESIIGRIVSAMGLRWHPQCFKCCTCGEHLEHVSSYEHEGKPYCHLDYHELFAPQCYTCKTPIIDERFITLDDPSLGKRTYHEQHFFCAECGDPFLAPSSPAKASARSGPNEISIKGDGAFDIALDADGDEVGFTVFRGHPYCEACHVRLRAPKCKGCKRSIRDGMRAVEALGGKWCYECFVCAGCQEPFEEPSFFQRDKKPYCQHCFSIILRNEL